MTAVCPWCDEPIGPDDALAGIVKPHHLECIVRALAGGVNHQQGLCTCCGGDLPPDPPWMTKREAARAAEQMYRSRR